MPPLGIDLFLLFLADSGPKRRVRFGNERRNPESMGMARCDGCASLCRFARGKVTHRLSARRERSRILVQVYGHAAANVLRQMQAAARKVKGAGVAAGAGVAGTFPVQCSIDQRSGADKKC